MPPLPGELSSFTSEWEGSNVIANQAMIQRVANREAEACGIPRINIAYQAMAAQDLYELLNKLGVFNWEQLPLWFIQQGYAGFLNQGGSVLLGFELNPSADPNFTSDNLLQAYRNRFSTVAVITLPGVGYNLFDLFDQNGAFVYQNVAMVLKSMVDATRSIWNVYAQQDTSGSSFARSMESAQARTKSLPGPQTPATTGIPIVDVAPGGQGAGKPSAGSTAMWVGAAIAVGIAALLLAWSQSED